jgi:hypothetical protein
MNEPTFIGIDNQRLEVSGEQLEQLEAEQAKRNLAFDESISKFNDLRTSALAKLIALGLTEEEIAAL